MVEGFSVGLRYESLSFSMANAQLGYSPSQQPSSKLDFSMSLQAICNHIKRVLGLYVDV